MKLPPRTLSEPDARGSWSPSYRGPILAALLGLAATACSPAPPESWEGHRSLLSARSAPEPGITAATALLRPSAPPPDPSCERVLGLLDTFQSNLKKRLPPRGVLATMETCLVQSGRLLDLLGLLQVATEAHPKELEPRRRLAAAFIRLGDPAEALRQAEALRRLAPDDPEALFLVGLSLGHQPEPGIRQIERARDAWTRLLEVAPKHRGMGSYPPEEVREEVARWGELLSTGPPPPAPSSM